MDDFSSPDPTPEEIARWEDDGGATRNEPSVEVDVTPDAALVVDETVRHETRLAAGRHS